MITAESRTVLEAQRAVLEAKQKKTGSVIPWVFHRTKRGRPLTDSEKRGSRRVSTPACRVASCTTSGELRCAISSGPGERVRWIHRLGFYNPGNFLGTPTDEYLRA